MKKIATLLLLAYPFVIAIQAQNNTLLLAEKSATKRTDNTSSINYDAFYLDAGIGYLPYRTDAAWAMQLGVGTRLNEASALGVSSTFWGRRQIYRQSALGLGLQYRLSFWDNLIGKIEGGYVVNHTVHDGVLHKDLVFVPSSSRPFYYKLDINYRFFRYCTLGISACQSGNLFFRRFAGSGTETVDKWRISTITVQLGIALDKRD